MVQLATPEPPVFKSSHPAHPLPRETPPVSHGFSFTATARSLHRHVRPGLGPVPLNLSPAPSDNFYTTRAVVAVAAKQVRPVGTPSTANCALAITFALFATAAAQQ